MSKPAPQEHEAPPAHPLVRDNAMLRAVLENMDQAILIMDRELRLVGWNLRCVDLLDLPQKLLETYPTLDEIAEYHAAIGDYAAPGVDLGDADREEQIHFWANQRSILENWPVYERQRPNGTVFEVRTQRLPDEGFVCTYTDITERKENEELARRRREELRQMLDLSPIAVVVTARDGRVLWSSSRLAQRFGAPRDTLIGRNARDWWADPAVEDELTRRIERDGQVRDLEAEMISPAGERWWALVSADVTELEGTPAVTRWIYDVTQRRLADDALRQSEQRLKLAMAISRSGVWDADFRSGAYWWLPEFLGLLGYDPDELPRDAGAWERLIDDADRDRVMVETARYLAGRTSDYHLVYRMRRKEGGALWVEARGHVFRDENGVAVRFTGMMADITERKHAEAALATARERLLEAEKMAALGSLVAGVAHEINTPIGTALTAATHLADRTAGFVEAMDTGALKRRQAVEYAHTAEEATGLIVANVTRAGELVQSFKQVAVDQSSDERRDFALGPYIEEVLVSLRPRLRKGQHAVDVACPPDLRLDGYPGALSQILTNLVINALTHAFGETEGGRIAIDVAVAAPDGQGDQVTLRFSDNGCGIPESHLPRVFEPFFTTRRGAGGTGLGLHIVYNIVTRRLGGAIAVDSPPGHGTTFLLRFPRVAPRGIG